MTGQQDKAFRSAVKSATQEIENRKNAEKKAWQETNKQVASFKPSNIVTSGGATGGRIDFGNHHANRLGSPVAVACLEGFNC